MTDTFRAKRVRDDPEYRAAQVVRVREWRQRNPGYRSAMGRVERMRRTRHLCPGNGRPCMVEISGDRLFCTFCAKGAA